MDFLLPVKENMVSGIGIWHIDAKMTRLDVAPERLGHGSTARKDGHAVAILVAVYQLDRVV